jgi:hypothetical protein
VIDVATETLSSAESNLAKIEVVIARCLSARLPTSTILQHSTVSTQHITNDFTINIHRTITIMKVLTLATSTLFATSVSAGIGFFGGKSIDVAPWDDSLDVPGENPLQHCQDPKDDILDLKQVDLDPNPPLP